MAASRAQNSVSVMPYILNIFVNSLLLPGWSSGLLTGRTNQVRTTVVEELANTSASMVRTLNSQPYYTGPQAIRYPTVILISQMDMWPVVQVFRYLMPNCMFIDLVISHKNPEMTLFNDTFIMFSKYSSHLPTIVLFLNNSNDTVSIIEFVCSSLAFKWTHLIHTAEWILVTRNLNFAIDISCQSPCMCIDYFTVITWSKNGTGISRKSRRNSPVLKKLTFSLEWSSEAIREVFQDLSSPKKIGLEGFHLTAGIVEGYIKHTDITTVGNATVLDGYAMTLLSLLATHLKFAFSLVSPSDGGDFGFAQDDGTATGVVGLLARKEVAISCMGLSKTDDRLHVVDFIDTAVFNTPIFITYRLPEKDGQVDVTLVNIIHLDFFLMCLGPVLAMAVIGGLLHVLTRSCSLTVPVAPSEKDVRRLATFPQYVCFQKDTSMAGQSGRILQTSWALFLLIMGAGYSAYLVTSFAVKPNELKIDSLEKLLQQSEYKIGVLKFNSAVQNALNISKDSVKRTIWDRIIQVNKTDPSTISGNITKHVLHIMSGNYALIDHFSVEDLPVDENNGHYSQIRSYQVLSFDSLAGGFVAVAKNAFFQDIINMAVLHFEEVGILQYLRDKYRVEPRSTFASRRGAVLKADDSVRLSRIIIVVYVVLCCIGVAVVCLMLEYVWNCWRAKTRHVKTIK